MTYQEVLEKALTSVKMGSPTEARIHVTEVKIEVIPDIIGPSKEKLNITISWTE